MLRPQEIKQSEVRYNLIVCFAWFVAVRGCCLQGIPLHPWAAFRSVPSAPKEGKSQEASAISGVLEAAQWAGKTLALQTDRWSWILALPLSSHLASTELQFPWLQNEVQNAMSLGLLQFNDS